MTLRVELEIEVTDGLQQKGFESLGETIEEMLPKYCHNLERIEKIKISRVLYENVFDHHDDFSDKGDPPICSEC